MAANLTNTYRQSAGILADAYGLTEGWATDSWTTNGNQSSWKTRNRLISITAQTAAGAAEWLNLNHQIFQFERFHSFSSLGGGPRSLRHARACWEGRMNSSDEDPLPGLNLRNERGPPAKLCWGQRNIGEKNL